MKDQTKQGTDHLDVREGSSGKPLGEGGEVRAGAQPLGGQSARDGGRPEDVRKDDRDEAEALPEGDADDRPKSGRQEPRS